MQFSPQDLVRLIKIQPSSSDYSYHFFGLFRVQRQAEHLPAEAFFSRKSPFEIPEDGLGRLEVHQDTVMAQGLIPTGSGERGQGISFMNG
jgi:hypothetical protein